MLDPKQLKPITGTFLAPLVNDTGINNWGLKEWDANFRILKQIGMDTVIIIGVEYESGSHRQSGLDPRNTTWPEDPNLVSMAFRLCDEYDLRLYLGGVCNGNNIYPGRYQEEISENRRFFEMMLDRFGKHRSFYGLYMTLEACPWQYHWAEIVEGILTDMRRLAPEKKTLMSPSFNYPIGDMSTRYTPDLFGEVYGRMFDRLKGKLDACAWQDKFFEVDCRLGEMLPHEAEDWYRAARTFLQRNNIELWANVESFQRLNMKLGDPSVTFRQGDYRTLIAKIQAASPLVDKIITFEYFTCMSPHAEWGSAGRLLERYLEAVGLDRSKLAQR